MDAEEITLVIMLRPIGQHLLPGRRLPPKHRRLVETNQRPMAMRAHVDIFHARVGEILAEAPTDAVHVVLHRHLGTHPLLAELLNGIERGRQSLLVRQLIEIQVHRRQFDASFLHSLLQPLDLLRRTALQVLAHRPSDLARPAELREIGIIVCRVAIIQRVIDIPQVLRQDFHLRTGITNVRMRMLHHIHLPMANRLDRHRRLLALFSASQRQRQPCRCAHLWNLEQEHVLARHYFLFPATLAQTNRGRGGLSLILHGNLHLLRQSAFRLIHRRQYPALHVRPSRRRVGRQRPEQQRQPDYR